MYLNVTKAGIHVAESDTFTEFEVRTPLGESELIEVLAAEHGAHDVEWGFVADGHVWVSKHRIIAEVEPLHEHAARWRDRFDQMLAYAAQQGWIDATGDYVRAHVAHI